MGRRLLRGLSGAAVFLVSVALLSVRHRGAEETSGETSPGLRDGMLENPERWTQKNSEDAVRGGGRGQNLQIQPPEEYTTQGSLTLGDVFIAVKTTKRFHQSRMELLLDTWITRAREQVSVWIWAAEGVRGGGIGDGVSVGRDKANGRGNRALRSHPLPRFP